MREVVLAAAIQGAIFAATKAAIDRAGARGFKQAHRRLAGRLKRPALPQGRTRASAHPEEQTMTGTRQRESAVDRIRERVEEKAARRRGRGAKAAGASRPRPRPRPAARGRAQRRRSCPASTRRSRPQIPWRGLEADPQAGVGGEQGRQHADHRRRRRLLRVPGDLPGADRADLASTAWSPRRRPWPSRWRTSPPSCPTTPRPHRGAADGDRQQQRQRPHPQPDRLDPRRAVERVGRRRQPDHRGEHRLRRGGGPQLRQAQADLARR